MSTTRMVYILRSQCDQCKLDKMEVFYRLPNATPSDMISQLKPHIKRKFREVYKCKHKVKFTREIDKDFIWDLEQNKPIKRER